MIAYAVWNQYGNTQETDCYHTELIYVHASEAAARDWMSRHVSGMDGQWTGTYCFSSAEESDLEFDEYYVENLVIHEE